jgi:hypothetical protein
MIRRSVLFALGLAAVLTASQAQAGSITGLFSTGVDAGGVPLPDGAADPHYTLTSPADPTVGPSAFAVSGHFPIPPWVANTATAEWIEPKASEPIDGAYNYTTHFTVVGDTAVAITGKLSADDILVDVLLNGVSLGITTPDHSFTSLHPFSIKSGFVVGDNTLEFLTMNVHAVVTGLIVDMRGTAVPEPASLAMFGIGLSGLFAFRRFFNRAKPV